MGSESCASHPHATSRVAQAIGVYKTLHSEILFPWHLLNLCQTCYSYSSIYHVSLVCRLCCCDHWPKLPPFLHLPRSCWAFSSQPLNHKTQPTGQPIFNYRSWFWEVKTQHILPLMSLIKSKTPSLHTIFLFSCHVPEIHIHLGGWGQIKMNVYLLPVVSGLIGAWLLKQ